MSEDAVPQDGASESTGEAASPQGDAPQTPALSTADLEALRREAAQAKASQRRADKLEEELRSYRDTARKAELDAAGEDGRLQAELDQYKRALAEAEKKARLATIKAENPRAFEVLGDDLLNLTDERIAALNATLQVEPTPPAPLGNNPARDRSQPPKTVDEMSIDELKAHLRGQANPWFTG